MCSNLKAIIIIYVTGEYFRIRKGMKQGDLLSLRLFNTVFEEIFRRVNWEVIGININREYLSCLRFGDDVILLSKRKTELQKLIIRFGKSQ